MSLCNIVISITLPIHSSSNLQTHSHLTDHSLYIFSHYYSLLLLEFHDTFSFLCLRQACRGNAYDDGMDVAVVPDEEEEEEEDKVDGSDETDTGGVHLRHKRPIVTPAPIFKDYLVMYATTPGRSSGGTQSAEATVAVTFNRDHEDWIVTSCQSHRVTLRLGGGGGLFLDFKSYGCS